MIFQSTTPELTISAQDDQDQDSDDESYMMVWEKPGAPIDGPPPPLVPPRKIFTIEDFTLIKVLGKGSFGKVTKSISEIDL